MRLRHAISTLAVAALIPPAAWATSSLPTVTVHKSPTCGCCEKWIGHMKASGFDVVVNNVSNVSPYKQRAGVPLSKSSCHTAEVAGYFVEGHVPATDVKRLLAAKTPAKGLVSPGMPISAPGMDSVNKQPFEVLLVSQSGGITTYARH